MIGLFEKIKVFFRFSRGEIRGILWLLPLLGVIAAIIVMVNRPRFEKSFMEQVGEDSERRVEASSRTTTSSRTTALFPAAADSETYTDGELFAFDPNTVTIQELCRLGFSTRTAAGIIKYRERGKRFEIPEDFATCYGVTIEQYTRLEPYINIGTAWRRTPQNTHTQGVAREVVVSEFDPNDFDADGFAELGFTPAQARTIIKYRTSIGGFRTAEEFGKSYAVSPQMLERLRPYIVIKPAANEVRAAESKRLVDLNAADSTELRSVNGIGEALVVRIMDYRRRLGGYARIEQLAEIPGMAEENFNRIRAQIFVDSCVIQKIDINFASHQTVVDVLGNHPYVTAQGLRKLLKNRQLKGGWRSIEEMVDQNIVTPQQAVRLAPYLIFRTE